VWLGCFVDADQHRADVKAGLGTDVEFRLNGPILPGCSDGACFLRVKHAHFRLHDDESAARRILEPELSLSAPCFTTAGVESVSRW
jgi:hypothetical protein